MAGVGFRVRDWLVGALAWRMVASSIFRMKSESATLWKHSSAFIAETTMGRRKIDLDPAEVERLAAQGLAEYQIAEALGISQDTLDRRKQDSDAIAEALQRGRGAHGERSRMWRFDAPRRRRRIPGIRPR